MRLRTAFAAAPSSRRFPSSSSVTASAGESLWPESVRSRIGGVRRAVIAPILSPEVRERPGLGNQSVFRGQAIERGESLEVAGVELEVEGVTKVVLDYRR